MDFTSPLWLPGGNAQTIWPALFSRRTLGPTPRYTRERWTTPDHDFIDVDWLAGVAPHEPPLRAGEATPAHAAHGDGEPRTTVTTTPAARPLLVQFHGLEGSSTSHYSQAFAEVAHERGWAYAVPHFRGCSGELNRAPRAYHSGDVEEIDWILQRFHAWQAERGGGPLWVVGISLGGNALMRWAADLGEAARRVVHATAAVSSPLDLSAGGHAIGRGFNRLVYTRMFLNTLKPKALARLARHPGLFSADAMRAARDLWDFDNVFTAPVHGFRDAQDYWHRASAKPHLHRLRVPALLLNARNDPFVPADSLPQAHEVSDHVTLWQPEHGGHVGFPTGRWPGHVRAMPEAVSDWLAGHSNHPTATPSPDHAHG